MNCKICPNKAVYAQVFCSKECSKEYKKGDYKKLNRALGYNFLTSLLCILILVVATLFLSVRYHVYLGSYCIIG